MLFRWRRHPDLNRGVRVLQTRALPLGYVAVKPNCIFQIQPYDNITVFGICQVIFANSLTFFFLSNCRMLSGKKITKQQAVCTNCIKSPDILNQSQSIIHSFLLYDTNVLIMRRYHKSNRQFDCHHLFFSLLRIYPNY